MTNEKLLHIGLKKMKTLEEDLEKIAAENVHELLRAWELKHRVLASESVYAAHPVPQGNPLAGLLLSW